MIYMMGDTHGDWNMFKYIEHRMEPNDIIIHVGDFGFYNECMQNWHWKFPNGYPCKVYAIPGNHEDYRLIRKWEELNGISEPIEVMKNVFYVPRGVVMELEGKLFAFLGGAESVDRYWRVKEESWFADESVRDEEVDRLIKNINGRHVDVLVTHSPPYRAIAANFPKINLESWGLPKGWNDNSADKIQALNISLNPDKHFCGHMHKAVLSDRCRILDIEEIVELK